MSKLHSLKKKLARLERKYDRARGPVERGRLLKTAAATQKKINDIEQARRYGA